MLQRSVKADRKAGRGGGSQTNMITSKNVKHFNAQNKGNSDRKGRGNTQASALWGKHCVIVNNPSILWIEKQRFRDT